MAKSQETFDPAGSAEFDFEEPPMYRVLLLNDDYTPMDFVVMILMDIFHKSKDDAERIMMAVHRKGSGLCGVYPYEVAEAKTAEVEETARSAGYPLRCRMEEDV